MNHFYFFSFGFPNKYHLPSPLSEQSFHSLFIRNVSVLLRIYSDNLGIFIWVFCSIPSRCLPMFEKKFISFYVILQYLLRLELLKSLFLFFSSLFRTYWWECIVHVNSVTNRTKREKPLVGVADIEIIECFFFWLSYKQVVKFHN